MTRISRDPMARRVPPVLATLAAIAMLLAGMVGFAVHAGAQDTDAILADLESDGFHIETGADGTDAAFSSLVSRTRANATDRWYFVSLAGAVDADFADLLRDAVRPTGNVLLFYWDIDDFPQAQLASSETEAVEFDALAPIESADWTTPDEFMTLVVAEFDRITGASGNAAASDSGSTSTGTTSTGSASSSNADDSGGGNGWIWFAGGAAAIGGGIWYSGRRRRKKAEEARVESAAELRDALQTEIDELANDVIVLSGPVDLSEDEQAVEHYRAATATYTAISEEIPDLDGLDVGDFDALHDLGVRVAHARWQMDAAEAIIDGEPIPDKPEVEPPPEPEPGKTRPAPAALPPQVRSRAPRPRTRSTGRRRSGGGGLLDILIGAGMANSGRRRRGGGMFGGSTRTAGSRRSSGSSSQRRSSPRPGGGVFGGGSSRSSTRRSTSRSGSRRRSGSTRRSSSRSRASGSRRSTSRSGSRRRRR
ncbi:MAG: hypothetical protein AAF567_00045 [Actinomycetota bacterium]